MLLQWRDELESRFGLSFVIFDRDYVSAIRRERGYSVNPWFTHSHFLISHALIRDPAYTEPLRDWLGDFAPGSLLIMDEAHNAAPASGARYATDSNLTRAIRGLAHRFEHRLFLSATPHNGHPNSFAALLELLDPQRFCRGVPIGDSRKLQPVMVRRLKSDLRAAGIDFPKRRIVEIDFEDLPQDAPELVLSNLLDQYRRARESRTRSLSRSQQVSSALIITCLQKRLVSSVEAFYRTLNVHRRAVQRALQKASSAGAQLSRPGLQTPSGGQKIIIPPPDQGEVRWGLSGLQSRQKDLSLLIEPPDAEDARAELPEDEVRAEEDAQMETATASTVEPSQRELMSAELRLIEEMLPVADQARGAADRRVGYLADWIKRNMLDESGRWNRRRVLIFTKYLDTKRYLEQQLRAAISGTDRADLRIASFVGGVDEDREAVKRAFNEDPNKQPLRILIATDAAREGVNLQNYCADLFHFDLPWNPSRMEQRNGRIDRKLQREKEVRCHYFVFTQRPEDRVLRALARKTETIQRELGSLSPVLASKLASRIEHGVERDRADQIAQAIEREDLPADRHAAIFEELEPVREKQADLNRQLEQLRALLDTSEKSIGLNQEHFRDALSCALSMHGAEPLERLASPDGTGPQRWRFPRLDDPTWAETLDTLRAARKAGQPIWEWRREAPIRPVVFEDSGKIDQEVVHLHLEHGLVRRLLGRFIAQGFTHDLRRATALLADDAIPRVVLFGRLSLFGSEAARLHDEIIAATAQWRYPEVRRGPLRPYAEGTEREVLRLLEDALEGRADAQLPEQALRDLQSGVEQDVHELTAHLAERAEQSRKRAIEQLRIRGEREAREMVTILETQRSRIQQEIEKHDQGQLQLQFNETERRQVDADRRHWQHRLTGISAELESEPARIRASYKVRTHRMEPVGIVYLWPRSG
jgi:hypothetical protein